MCEVYIALGSLHDWDNGEWRNDRHMYQKAGIGGACVPKDINSSLETQQFYYILLNKKAQ